MQRIRHFLRRGHWLFIMLCLLMLLTATPNACAATANFDVQTAAGYHGGYMAVSITITVEPTSRIALAATLTDDDGSVLRDGTVFSQEEGDTSLTIDFSLPVGNRMTGTEDHIHISCIADANGQTYAYNRSIDWAIAHDDSVRIIEPTCSSIGHTYLRCTKCGYERDFILPMDPAKHDWGDWVSNHDGTHTRACKLDSSHTENGNCQMTSRIIEPTCTEKGYTDHTCALCSYGYQDGTVPSLGHDWGAWTNNGNSTHSRICRRDPSHTETLDCIYTAVVIPPTCDTPGLTTHICNACYDSYDDTPTPAMGHDWGDWASNHDGTHTRTCKRDPSHKETENCAFVDTVVPPTCREPGYTTHRCTVCGYEFADQTVPPLLHDWSDWISNGDGTHTRVCRRDSSHQETENCRIINQVIEPTCTEEGYTDYSCVLCGYGYEDMIAPALGHDWGNWTSNNDGTHTRTCKRDPSHNETENCAFVDTMVPPTCREPGYTTHRCAVCGYEFADQTVPPLLHDWSDWTSNGDGTHTRTCKRDLSHRETENCRIISQVIEPTCTEEGYTDYSCVLCGYGYEDMIAPALGHDWGNWTSNNDGTHTRTCKRDPSHNETENCAFVDTMVPPTCREPGYTTHRCAVCGYEFADQTVPPLLHDWSDWTSNGDGTHTRTCKRDLSHRETENCRIISQVIEPTCTEEGHTDYSCVLCGYGYEDMIVPALRHDWGYWTSNNDGTHTRTCKHDPSHRETEKCHIVSQTVEPTCTEEGYTDYSCSVCGYGYIDMFVPAIGHQPGAWRSVLEPTRYAPGKEEQRCMDCDTLLKERVVPKLNGMRYGNTACIDGPHFRDNIPKVTDKWYSYGVIDLEKEGVTEYPLIASNRYRIGTVFVTVNKTELTVRYQFSISRYELREEFLTYFSSLENIRTLDTEKLKGNTFAFNQPTPLSEVPQEKGKTILFMRLLLNYDSFDQGVSPW